MSEKTTVTAKKKLKPNVVDFLIILIILGVIASLALRAGVLNKSVSNHTEMQEAVVSFLVLDINNNSGEYFRVNETFYIKNPVLKLGELTSVQIMPAEVFVSGEDGKMVKTYSNNARIDVRGTFASEGIFSDAGFLLGGSTYIAPGSKLEVQSADISVTMMITDVQKTDSEK